MDNMTYLFAAVVLLAEVLASISIWALGVPLLSRRPG